MKKSIIIIAVLVVAVLIVMLFSLQKRHHSFKLTESETISLIFDSTGLLTFNQFQNIDNSGSNVLLVDIRHPDLYNKGFIPQAVNIPTNLLLGKKERKIFTEAQKRQNLILVYGDQQYSAIGSYFFLKEMGFSNVKYLEGGYDQYLKRSAGNSETFLHSETSIVNIEELKPKPTIEKPAELPKKKVVVVPVKKEAPSGGGC